MGRFLIWLLASLLVLPATPLPGFARGHGECCEDACECAHAASSCCSSSRNEVRLVAACSCNEPEHGPVHLGKLPVRIAPCLSRVTLPRRGSGVSEVPWEIEPQGQRLAPEPPPPRRA